MHLATANHEAAHAAAALLAGHRVTELAMNGGTYEGHAVHLYGRTKPLEDASIARVGALYSGDDWASERCQGDRSRVESLCPPELAISSVGVQMWQEMVYQHAAAIMDKPGFHDLALGLADALRRRWSMDEDEIAEVALLLEDPSRGRDRRDPVRS